MIWLVALLALGLFLFSNLPWQLDDYDQAKQAFTSFEMINEGHWLYQTTPHQHVATKPPLVGWISAGLFEVTRSWSVAWRLPSLLSAGAIAVVLFLFGRAAFGIVPGLIALAAFAFNLLTPRLATLVRTDMPLALVIFLTGVLVWQKIRSKEPWTAKDQLKIFFLLTAGMLIKGPVIYAFLLPGIAVFNWCYRKDRVSAWPGWWPCAASLGVFLLWVVGGIGFVPGFYEQVVLHEFLGRFGGDAHRAQPWFFYIPHLLHKFFPWSVLMILIAVVRARSREAGLSVSGYIRKMSPETCWLLFWSVGGLVVMSLLSSKRVDRIFPVIPPLCLLLAGQVSEGLKMDRLRAQIARWSASALIVACLFTSGYSIWKIGSGYRYHRDALAKFGRAVRFRAVANNWRYEAISTVDEGLLLYLRKTHFVSPGDAVADWNDAKLDGLVVPVPEVSSLLPRLNDSFLSSLRSDPRPDGSDIRYVWITRGRSD
jgi:4-amino-4-deoxy-L-arabinose transferase-like glycosyltransferase